MLRSDLGFLSTYEGKIDDKNRVSVPVGFREVLDQIGSEIYAYSSFVNDCVEVCTAEKIKRLQEFLDTMDPFSVSRDAIATAVLSDCEYLRLDTKGRVSLPDRLVHFANLHKDVLFVGKGMIFEIWSKHRFLEHYKNAREIAKNIAFTQYKT